MFAFQFQRLAFKAHFFAALVVLVLADPNDWVNVDYVISQAKDQSRSAVDDAKAAIIRNAQSSAGKGPWSVTNHKNNVSPPSNDPHDYLSWAPYHWPNCDWCTKSGRTHLAHTSAGLGQNDSASSTSTYSTPDPNDAYGNEAVQTVWRRRPLQRRRLYTTQAPLFDVAVEQGQDIMPMPPISVTNLPVQDTAASLSAVVTVTTILPSKLPNLSVPIPTTTSTSESRGHGPAQAAAKTTKASCTASPTTSLAPSATWTTCNYVMHDGQVNPDVRTLNGPDAINNVAQAVIYSAVAYALTQSSTHSQNVAAWIKAFFLDSATKMNPNMNFGQVVRGPGPDGISGTFTGVLDLRGMVKITNGIAIVKAANSPDWTEDMDQQMRSWMSDYDNWLSTSTIGMKTATRPNNHATFHTSQVAVAKMSAEDRSGAIAVLQGFFSTTFMDQVAHTGEQPFEAIRTRPYHYRCFNLEALITNAKLGDQLGIDLWTCKSKYGATIQTALDFMMAQNPKNEDVSQIIPHVACVAAAYGDPTGKYAAFLKQNQPTYQSKPYWFYDQPAALANAPSSTKKSKRVVWQREDSPQSLDEPDPLGANLPFECPNAFRDAAAVEIDNGLFVTCDELRPFFM